MCQFWYCKLTHFCFSFSATLPSFILANRSFVSVNRFSFIFIKIDGIALFLMCIIYTLKYIEHSAAHTYTSTAHWIWHSSHAIPIVIIIFFHVFVQADINIWFLAIIFDLIFRYYAVSVSIQRIQTNIFAKKRKKFMLYDNIFFLFFYYSVVRFSLLPHFQFGVKGWTLIFTFMLMNLDEMWIELTLSSITMFALIITTNEIDYDKLDALM